MLSKLDAAIVQNPLIAKADATLLSAIEQMNELNLHEENRIEEDNLSSTFVVILSDGLKVLGILTQKDVIRLVTQQQPIAKLTLNQFLQQQRSLQASLTISESALNSLGDLNAAIAYFESLQTTHLPIVDAQERLVGVLLYEPLKRLKDANIHQTTASLLARQQKILERIAKAEPLQDILSDLLQTMEAYLPSSYCSITLCQNGRLTKVTAPNLPQEYAVAVAKANLPIAEGVGSCGTAAFRRELVVVTDIANDPLWQGYKHFALDYGLQACSSMPIVASDQTLLGTFGIYYREQQAPQAQELVWIAQAANIAGIAIERDRATQALQQLNQDLENRVQVRTQELQEREQFLQTVLDTFPLSVFWKDVNSVYLGCNQNFLSDAGLSTVSQIIGKTDDQLPWGETEAEFYRTDDRVVIESQTAKLGIVETQHQANGQTIWLETNKLPLRNLQGEVIGVLGTYQNISDRKSVEIALQANEAKFRRITESVPGMIFRYVLHPDARDELLYVSPQVQQIFELTPEAVLQDLSCLWARFHPEDIPKSKQAIQDSAVSLQPFFLEVRLLMLEDQLKWIQFRSQPDRQENGDVIWDGVVIDITEQKQSEQKLQELSERLELAIQSAQIGIWEFDFSSNRLFWDERMLAIHGISPEAFHGTYEDWSSRVHPDDLLQAHPDISEDQAIYNTEFRIIRPDGTVRWIMSYSYKQRNHQGELVRAVGVNLDISDRKKAEIALQDLSARLEFALKGANIGIWEWLADEDRVLWDDRMLSIYGVAPENFAGKYIDWFQRIHPDDQDWLQHDKQRAALQGAKEFCVEFRIVRPDGAVRFIDSFSFNQYNTQGKMIKTIGLNIDITDRKQAELQLQRINEELIRATRLKDEFLANMSHELRTPLNAILGMTEILQEQIFGELNARQQQYLQTIEKSSKHLLELINDILDVAKIEAGQVQLSCQPSNIESLCQSSVVFIKQLAFKKNIQIESLIPRNLPTITIDERRIRQVLINLLNNAVKFTPDGGKISLIAKYIPCLDKSAIAGETSCDTLEISVVDTGIGIVPEQISRLFQPFVQVESALNRSYNGTGLGLALVKRLVELHGGEVRLTSELGVGSCFTIAIPVETSCALSVVPESSLPLQHKASEPESKKLPVILIAEDNESNIEMLTDYLSLKGYQLVIANNGQTAINLAQQNHPDVILMDIQMPEMDGLEAIQRIRQMPELIDTPIIALTALAMPSDRDRCLEMGANEYLSKPVVLRDLVNLINGYLTKSCQRS